MKKIFITLLSIIFLVNLPFDSAFAKGKKRSSKKQPPKTNQSEETADRQPPSYRVHLHLASGVAKGWLNKTSSEQDSTFYESDLSFGNIALSAITQYGNFPLGISLSLYYEGLNHGYSEIDANIASQSVEAYSWGLDLFVLIDYSNFTFFGAVTFYPTATTSINEDVYYPQRAWGVLIGLKYRLVNSFALLLQTSYQKMFDTNTVLNEVDTTFSGSVLRISFGISFTIRMYFPSFT